MLPAGAAASGGDYDPNAASLFSCGKSRLKGRYSTEIGGSDAFYLVIESKGITQYTGRESRCLK